MENRYILITFIRRSDEHMETFVELTHYKMLNELSRNSKAKILIIQKKADGSLSAFEITKNTSPDILKSIILSHDDTHIFMRENDYEKMCIDSYQSDSTK